MALIEGKNAQVCNNCDELKSFDEFHKAKNCKYGYRPDCKECKSKIDKKYYKENNIKDRVYKRNVIRNSFERNLDDFKCWVLEIKQCGNCKEYKDFNKFGKRKRKFGLTTKCRDCLNKYQNERRKNNHAVKLRNNMTSRMNLALENDFKSDKTKKLIGCSIQHLKKHIEDQFEEGMSWDERSKWHIDHEIPLNKFDLDCPYQQRVSLHWSNVQPLWAEDNYSKPKNSIVGFGDIDINKEFLDKYKLV